MEKKILFIDLDGTLIETISGDVFPKGIWDMKWKDGILDAIKNLSPKYVFIVSNQGGIEKGFVKQKAFITKIKYVRRCIMDYANVICEYTYCPSNDKDNKYRKPNIGMFDYLYEKYAVPKDNGTYTDAILMVGDASGLEGQFSDSDKKAAENLGCDYMDVNDFISLMNNEKDTE